MINALVIFIQSLARRLTGGGGGGGDSGVAWPLDVTGSPRIRGVRDVTHNVPATQYSHQSPREDRRKASED